MKLWTTLVDPILIAALVLTPYGVVFFAATLALRVPEASDAIRRVARLQS